jgi:hypothetical protein
MCTGGACRPLRQERHFSDASSFDLSVSPHNRFGSVENSWRQSSESRAIAS